MVALLIGIGVGLVLLQAERGRAPAAVGRLAWTVLVSGFVALHLRPEILIIHWGFDTWAGLTTAWRTTVLAAGAVAALSIWQLLRWGVREPGASRARAFPGSRGSLAVGLGAAVILWLLRENLNIGDSWQVMEFAADGLDRVPLFPRWPVASAALGMAYRLAHRAVSAWDTVALVSCLAGGLGTVVALAVLRRLHPPGLSRWIAAAFLLTTYGIVQPFAEHIEVYALALLALLVFVWVTLGTVQGGFLWVAGAVGGLAIVTYIPLVIPVVSALGVLAWQRRRAEGYWLGAWVVAAVLGDHARLAQPWLGRELAALRTAWSSVRGDPRLACAEPVAPVRPGGPGAGCLGAPQARLPGWGGRPDDAPTGGGWTSCDPLHVRYEPASQTGR